MVAAIRPDGWDLAVFVHVAGAMLVVGTLVVVVVTMAGALRGGEGAEVLTGLAFRALLLGVLPAYIVMRAGAEWIASKEDVPDDVDWIAIGYSTADGGLLVTIITTVLAWGAARRGAAGPGGLGRGVVVLASVLIVAYAVAIWAMTSKPAYWTAVSEPASRVLVVSPIAEAGVCTAAHASLLIDAGALAALGSCTHDQPWSIGRGPRGRAGGLGDEGSGGRFSAS